MSRIIVPEKESQAYVSKLFQTIGAEKKHADVVADHLTMAEMRGQASHGLNRIPFYTQKLEHGGYKANPHMKILREDAGVALLDADDALGAVSCSHAMELCMEKASRTGCASCSSDPFQPYWIFGLLHHDGGKTEYDRHRCLQFRFLNRCVGNKREGAWY